MAGVRVADYDLMASALESGIADGVYVINDDLYGGEELPGPKQLETLYSRPVVEAPSSWLRARLCEPGQAIGFVSIVDFARFCLWRSYISTPIPICAVVHAIPTEELMPLYLAAVKLARPCDRVVVSSDAGSTAMRALLLQVEALLYPSDPHPRHSTLSDKLRVIPLPVSSPHLTSDTTALKLFARRALGLPVEHVVLLCFGRITSAYKADLESLIRAYASVHRSYPTTSLIIAGHEAEEGYVTRLKALVSSSIPDGSVRFVLNVPRYAKDLIYVSADIFVAPGDNIQETFGIALVEAMFAGLPVVASNWSGYREIVANAKTGFLIDTWLDLADRDALNMVGATGRTPLFERLMAQRCVIDVESMISTLMLLVHDEERRCSMGAAGRDQANSRYSWRVVARQFAELWSEQASIAASAKPSNDNFDYVRAFEHFPHASTALGMRRVCSPHKPNDDSIPKGLAALYQTLDQENIGILLEDSEESRRLTLKMLKKGILGIGYDVPKE